MIQQLASQLNKALQIGRKTIATRLVLAPMTYLGHVAFRQLLEELGFAGLMFSEMCSAGRIPHEKRSMSAFFRWREAEADRLVIQIVGSNPLIMAAAAQRIEAEGLWGVDINLGCAVKAICRFNQGAALLNDPAAAVRIVQHVRQAVGFPVTVKFRTGWRDDFRLPVEMAQRLEDAGADALTFHPRVAPDRRNRPPRWEYIARVKHAVRIPVFGNGDVFDADSCLKMLEMTGCDGVALGRLAVARPWIFAQWLYNAQPPDSILRDTALRMVALLTEHFDNVQALRRFKRYAAYFASNYAFGNYLYNLINSAGDFDVIRSILLDFCNRDPQRLELPNTNLLR
jgi:nifR3 family TIM-barrel protein